MAYFLGRDVNVYLATEAPKDGTTVSGVFVQTAANPAVCTLVSGASGYSLFARARDVDITGTAVEDVTGVDLSIGAVDEDITYFGVRSVTKAEIKKETTVSLTRKKSDSSWDAIYDSARYGITTAGSFTGNALRSPTINTGYRVYVSLKSGTEVFTIPGACIQSHTVSVNADGTSEETMEFMSYITPTIGNAADSAILTTARL